MKFIVAVILTIALSFAASLFFPWWAIAIAAFVVAIVIKQEPLKSFFAGFVALFVLWGGMSYYLSSANNNVLAGKVSMVILKSDGHLTMILLAAVIGALISGMGALCGSFLLEK